ncbi:MAG: hypothetical protein EPN85_08965 [Bacteroidetes bacterium]|nr:MAG: hypothetical protein EPN85_08965 [Bacteroidota bacterium]
MSNILLLSFALMFAFSSAAQNKAPDFSKTEDLKALGIGRIIEKDNSIIKKIALHEVKEYWIVYIKNESMHDMMMENIARIEFLDSQWGPLKIKFTDNKPEISMLVTY